MRHLSISSPNYPFLELQGKLSFAVIKFLFLYLNKKWIITLSGDLSQYAPEDTQMDIFIGIPVTSGISKNADSILLYAKRVKEQEHIILL